MANSSIYKGFVQGSIWAGKGAQRVYLPFQDTITEAKFMYSGEVVESQTFSDAGVLGTSQACLQSEEAGFELSTSDISWNILLAATLSDSKIRTKPVLVTETITLSQLTAGDSSFTTQSVPVLDSATQDEYGLPASGFSVADLTGKQYAGALTGSSVVLDDDYSGERVTIQYLRAPLTGEEVVYLGAGNRRQQVGIYGKFFGCPGSILIVAPTCSVVPKLDFGVSGGNIASAGLTLKCIRQNGYFAEITRLKDCEGC